MTHGERRDWVKACHLNPPAIGSIAGEIVRLFFCLSLGPLLVMHVNIAMARVAPGTLYEKASSEGSVRVIVQLRVQAVPEGHLDGADAVASQRQGIALTRSVVLDGLAGTNYRTIREFQTIPFVAVEVGPDALSVLESSPNVDGIEEDRLLGPLLSQSVPLIGADQAWAAGFDGTGIAVAIVDSGVDKTHPFLAGKVVEEACYSSNGNCPNGLTSETGPGAGVPCTYAPNGCGHGTYVAGIAAGSGASLSGVAKGGHIIAVSVNSRVTGTNCTGQGEDPCDSFFQADVIAGLERVFTLRGQYTIAAVNLSLGGGKFTAPCDSQQLAFKAVIDNLRSVGIATVVAAGNDGFTNALTTPACISTAVSVGSTTKADAISSFSDLASFLSLLAPGEAITSSIPGGAFATSGGTSAAAPHVAGAWAILKQKKPTATVTEVLNALTSTGLPIIVSKSAITKPRIRVNLALQTFVSPPSKADVPQMLAGFTSTDGVVPQQTFLTTDPIVLAAVYHDNAPTCIGVAPTFVQLFMFNLEGVFVLHTNASSNSSGAESKDRTLFLNLPSSTLTPGSYKFTFLVRDCTNTKSVLLPEFLTFRVISP